MKTKRLFAVIVVIVIVDVGRDGGAVTLLPLLPVSHSFCSESGGAQTITAGDALTRCRGRAQQILSV